MLKLKLFLALLVVSTCTKAAVSDTNYIEEHVTLHTSKGDIFGTLLLPATGKKVPVAMLIAGSGPTDRDGNNPFAMNGGLKKLAYALIEKNIATLRYDKRAIGESAAAGGKESDLRFTDYVNDAKGWIELLKKDKRFSSVTVIGHSEGSLIGMIAAKHGADKYISIAGVGVTADSIIKIQLADQPKAIRDMVYPRLDTLKRGDTLKNVSPMLYSLFRPGIQPYMISWMAYDPQKEIARLDIPVLIIQGTNDIQVSVDDAYLLKKADPKADFLLIKNMNHIFRIVTGDKNENAKTYNEASLPLAAELISGITNFILK